MSNENNGLPEGCPDHAFFGPASGLVFNPEYNGPHDVQVEIHPVGTRAALSSSPPLEAPGEVEVNMNTVCVCGYKLTAHSIDRGCNNFTPVRASRQGAREPEKSLPEIQRKFGVSYSKAAEIRDYFRTTTAGIPPATPSGAVQEPVAWMHTIEVEKGHGIEKTLTWNERSPFGVPGQDHSPDAEVKAVPLYTHPSPASQGVREAELEAILARINSPEVENFLEGVRLEAEHQRQRWGTEGDAGKSPEDWMWLLAYLATKATQAARYNDREKHLHHIITCGAVLLNWHRFATGEDRAFNPGAPNPEENPKPREMTHPSLGPDSSNTPSNKDET